MNKQEVAYLRSQ